MAKKTSKAEPGESAPSGPFERDIAGAVRESAQQIWLAGMGAFAKAQAEGGKVFEALVKEGAGLQRKTQAAAQERFGEAAGKMGSMASEASSRAGASWDKLEHIFEDRTAKALGKLGVPTAKEVAELARRVDELAAAVAKLSKAPAAKKAPAKKAAPRKAAAAKKTAD